MSTDDMADPRALERFLFQLQRVNQREHIGDGGGVLAVVAVHGHCCQQSPPTLTPDVVYGRS